MGPDWSGLNGSNDGSAFMEYIDGFSADGTNHLGMELDYVVWQDLGVTYAANTIYTMTVAIGNRDGHTAAGNISGFGMGDDTGTIFASGGADASVMALPGTFVDAPSVMFDTSSNPGMVGAPIRVGLQALGAGRSHYDNIRLDAQLVPEPATGLLACISLLGFLAVRRRK